MDQVEEGVAKEVGEEGWMVDTGLVEHIDNWAWRTVFEEGYPKILAFNLPRL